MKVVAISDVHGKWNKITIPECDLLISAGDYSFQGEKHVVKDFHRWLDKQPAKHIISVQGNHETWVEKNFEEAKALALSVCPRVHFIDEGPIEIEGVKLWCSAITPFFHNWAWNRYGNEIQVHWDRIPDDTQILVTHGPPYGILDRVFYVDGMTVKERVGCMRLYEKIMSIPSIKYHIFGHIHCDAGEQEFADKKFINASICDEMYQASNPIREFEI